MVILPRGGEMLATIDLDNYLRLETGEIDHVRTQRNLATKAVAIDLLAAQPHPKMEFSVRRLGAKLTGSPNFGARCVGHMTNLKFSRFVPPGQAKPVGGRAAPDASHARC
jgi:hypothetical protein